MGAKRQPGDYHQVDQIPPPGLLAVTEPFASGEDQAEREGGFAEIRRVDRTYASKGFDLAGHVGVRARFIRKVFVPEFDTEVDIDGEGTQWLVYTSSKGRVQVRLIVSREPGHVSEIIIQRINATVHGARADNLVTLTGEDARRFIELIKNLDYIPIEGAEGIRLDDALVRDLMASPESVSQIYDRDPDVFRNLIADDVAARDVIALSRRRSEVERFKRLLDERDYFDSEVALTPHKRPEDVWQGFFETNPWILGTGLSGQLFTSWDEDKLEQIVGGASIANVGKRADALMRTSGVVRWMTFAEFKTHLTPLQAPKYRPGTWPPSAELVGGIAQAQATVWRAMQEVGAVLRGTAADGSEMTDEMTFLTHPRSYLVIGQLGELLGKGGGPHMDKIRSFELFRRSVSEPEIVTFDELLARAEWVVDTELGV